MHQKSSTLLAERRNSVGKLSISLQMGIQFYACKILINSYIMSMFKLLWYSLRSLQACASQNFRFSVQEICSVLTKYHKNKAFHNLKQLHFKLLTVVTCWLMFFYIYYQFVCYLQKIFSHAMSAKNVDNYFNGKQLKLRYFLNFQYSENIFEH